MSSRINYEKLSYWSYSNRHHMTSNPEYDDPYTVEKRIESMQGTMKDHQQELLSMDDVTAMIAGQIGKFLPMDEETAEQFLQLAK